MATYGAPFLRLTFAGALRSVEQWSMTLNVDDPGTDLAPTQAQLDTIRDQFLANVMRPTTGTPCVGQMATLVYVKAARIGTDGKYIDAAPVVSNQPLTGSAGSGVSVHAPQIALAVTLLGPNPRGPAGRGRMYLPDPSATLGGDGRISVAAAQSAAENVSRFINQVNGVLTGAVSIIGPATASGRGPATQTVTAVRCGRVLDTIRSRRSSMPEEPVYSTVAITPPA